MIRKYFKDATFIGFTEALLQLRGLILMPFITRQFGTVNYGLWTQVAILLSTVTPLVFLGTDSSIVRYLPGLKKEKQQSYFSAWMLFLLGISSAFAILLIAGRQPLASLFFGESHKYSEYLTLAGLWLVSGALANGLRQWFRVRNEAKPYALSGVLSTVFGVASIVLMLALNQGVYFLVVYSICSDLLLCLIITLVIIRERGWLRPDYSILKPMLRFGIPLVPAGFALWGLNYLDRVFIANLSDLSQVGIYSLSYSLAYQVIPVIIKPWRAMFANSAAELYNKGDFKTLQVLFEKSAGVAFILGSAASVGLFVTGKQVLSILAPSEFHAAAGILLFISSGYVFSTVSSYYEVALGLVHKTYLSTSATIIGSVVNVILNFPLITHYGILGAAIATWIAFLTMLLCVIIFNNRYKVLRTNYWFVLKVILGSAVMGIVVSRVNAIVVQGIQNQYIQLAILTSIGVIIYAAWLLVTKVLTPSDFSKAISLYRK